MMKITSRHLHALERQVRESINIERCARKPIECLNLKNEWAVSKLPGVKVSRPKLIAWTQEDIRGYVPQVLQAAIKRGLKRIEYVADEE